MNKNTFNASYQEYLEIILRATNDKEKHGTPEYVSNIEIATAMNVKPPSVTEFLLKLQREGLIEYKKRLGVKLTQKGRDLANKVLENHHLLETFFTKVLELDDASLKHRLACAIEHDLISEPNLVNALKISIQKAEAAASKQP
ncbi:MAG: metal-dependent transcriptional regulator [Candidatus Lokiarchaeota archaeon]|nr:metal-dependent transcriptional regulator [Candidatus Lokiarchaeota archaeon]